MQKRKTTGLSTILLPAIILGVVGWVGVLFVVTKTMPNIGPRWLFFFFSVMAVTGTSLPVIAYLNHRFMGDTPAPGDVILREAILLGIYFPTLAWLQLSRVLTVVLAFLLAFGMALIELLLRLREKSRWEPK